MRYTKEDITHAKQILDKSLRDKKKIVIVITKVAKSGMSRRMKVYTSHEDGLSHITWHVGAVCGLSMNDDGLLVTGCGMDMAFWLANHLTYCLWGDKAKDMELKGNGGSGCLDWQCLY